MGLILKNLKGHEHKWRDICNDLAICVMCTKEMHKIYYKDFWYTVLYIDNKDPNYSRKLDKIRLLKIT